MAIQVTELLGLSIRKAGQNELVKEVQMNLLLLLVELGWWRRHLSYSIEYICSGL